MSFLSETNETRTVCESGEPAEVLVGEEFVGELGIGDVVLQLAGFLGGG